MELKKLTFKQYLESKQKLKEAVTRVPKCISEYSVHKYCKLIVGENKETKSYIALKPQHKIIVEWQYTTFENPTPLKIQFQGVRGVNELKEFQTYWQGHKLLQWLNRNTFEKNLF